MTELFKDQDFDLADPSNNLAETAASIKWLRPKEIISRPVIAINPFNNEANNVIQGRLDNCAFISSCDAISNYPHLLNKIFTDLYKSLYEVNHNGCIKINLWLDDKWTSVPIDDRLPTVDGKLIYGSCKSTSSFWLPLLEKAFAKIMGSYENLNAIDGGYVLYCLTGGMLMRLNPTHLNERASIVSFLKNAKLSSLLVGIVGSELKNENSSEFMSSATRSGHSFAILDLIEIPKYNKIFLKLRNSQTQMKISYNLNENDEKILKEFNLKKRIKSNEMYFSIEEFFSYFEIMNILVKLDQILPFKNEVMLCGASSAQPGPNRFENCLNLAHFVIELQNKDKNMKKLIEIVLNMTVEKSYKSEFLGYFILPIRERILNEDSILYVNYSFQKQTLTNLNPFSDKIKLLPGKFILGILVKSDHLPKKFNLRIATLNECQIIEHMYTKIVTNDIYFQLNDTNKKIKIIISKCCVCECVLDDSYVASESNIFCYDCYNSTYKCQICNVFVGKEYFTVDNMILCQDCINNSSDKF